MKRILLSLTAIIALAGCSFAQDNAAVQQKVAAFHSALSAGQTEQIYDTAGPQFQNAKPKPDALKFLDAVHRKLGAYKSGSQTSFSDNINNGVHSYTAVYSSAYEHGQATETFVYVIGDKTATLAGYHIASDALIEN